MVQRQTTSTMRKKLIPLIFNTLLIFAYHPFLSPLSVYLVSYMAVLCMAWLVKEGFHCFWIDFLSKRHYFCLKNCLSISISLFYYINILSKSYLFFSFLDYFNGTEKNLVWNTHRKSRNERMMYIVTVLIRFWTTFYKKSIHGFSVSKLSIINGQWSSNWSSEVHRCSSLFFQNKKRDRSQTWSI